MKKCFKKFLAVIVLVFGMFMTAACGDVPPPSNTGDGGTNGGSAGGTTNTTPTISTAQYTNVNNLNLFEDVKNEFKFDEHQGKIDDFIAYYDDGFCYAVYTEGVFHDYYVDYNDVEQHTTINIGEGYNIIQYNDDRVLVISNDDGELFVVDGYDDVKLFKLGCTISQFRYLYMPGWDGYHCYYEDEGYIKMQIVDDFDGDLEDPIDVYCKVYDADNNIVFTQRVRDVVCVDDDEIKKICIMTENDWSNIWSLGYEINDNRCYLKSKMSYSSINQIPNTVGWVYYYYGHFVQVKGDNQHVYLFNVRDEKYSTLETWYSDAVKIELPECYEFDDIEFIRYYESGMLFYIVKFNDGKYYELYGQYFDEIDIENGETLGMWKNNKLTNIDVECNIKRMYFIDDLGWKVLMLMDDGCLYTSNVHVNYEL